jgi:hypothetical protein
MDYLDSGYLYFFDDNAALPAIHHIEDTTLPNALEDITG